MTRDNFLDIMGDIDRDLIDDALNIQRAQRVELRYERKTLPRFITGIAACAAVFAMIIFVRFFGGISTQPGDSSVSLSNSSGEIEFKRGWDPENLTYKKLNDFWETGANVRVSAAELDGITAELILKNIKKEAGTELVNSLTGYDYTDYVGAEEIALYIHDNEGGRFIANNVTPHSYNDMKLINGACLFGDSTRIYKTDSEYVIMQYADCCNEQSVLTASFYGIDRDRLMFRDENGIYDCSAWRVGIAGDGRIGGWRYGYQASKSFEYMGGNKFSDPVYGYEMLWKNYGKVIYPEKMPEGYKSVEFENITGWDPEYISVIDAVFPGDSTVITSDSAGGVTASLILHNIIKRPGERHYIYSDDKYLDMWAAEDICLYITDTKGHRVLISVTALPKDGSVKFIPNDCLFDNCLRVVRTANSDQYYIMTYLTEKDDKPFEVFIKCDLEQYAADSPKDENGISIAQTITTTANSFSIGSYEDLVTFFPYIPFVQDFTILDKKYNMEYFYIK